MQRRDTTFLSLLTLTVLVLAAFVALSPLAQYQIARARVGASSGSLSIRVSPIVINCTPSSVLVGSSIGCKATVVGTSPSGQVTWSQVIFRCSGLRCLGGGSVSFSPTSCALVKGSCSVSLTGTAAGAVTVQAVYSGDSNNNSSSDTTEISVYSVAVNCKPSSVVVGSSTNCKAAVTGSSPTGTVTWSSSGVGKLLRASCTLSRGSCSVRYTPASASSSVNITASYSGDSHNPASSGTYSFTVIMKPSKTTVSCTPKSAVAGSSTTIICKAKVTGYSPTGAITWSQSGTGSVSFVPTFRCSCCTLVKGSCSVILIGATAGKVTLQATYSGDSNNMGSSRTTKLTIESGKTAIYVYPTSNMTASISATVGETFIIQLSSNAASTGYDWNVSTSTGIQYINYTAVSTSSLIGGPQVRNYFFKAVQAGSQTIILTDERAFGTLPYPVAARINLQVTVSAPIS